MIVQLRLFSERLETRRARLGLSILFTVTATSLTLLPFLRFLRSGTDMDYRTWFEVGRTVVRGGEIYPHSQIFSFMYPPTCALLLALPALFGEAMLILILASLNTLAWILCIKFSRVLLSDVRIGSSSVAIANLIVIPFVWSSYHLGQPSLVLLALMLGAFVTLQRGRGIFAGLLVAGAVAIKAFPLLAIFYFIYRRCWSAVISLLVTLVILLLLLPIPFRGWPQTVTDMRDWQRGMLRYEEKGIAQRSVRGYSWKNQSILGVANRLLRPVSIDDEPNPPAYANLANLDFKTVNTVIAVFALLLGLSFVAALPRQYLAADHRELAALLTMILIFTPLAFGYLFVWLVFPLASLIERVMVTGEFTSLFCLLMALALLTMTAIAPRFAQIYGSLFFATLTLYLGLAADLRRHPPLIAG